MATKKKVHKMYRPSIMSPVTSAGRPFVSGGANVKRHLQAGSQQIQLTTRRRKRAHFVCRFNEVVIRGMNIVRGRFIR